MWYIHRDISSYTDGTFIHNDVCYERVCRIFVDGLQSVQIGENRKAA